MGKSVLGNFKMESHYIISRPRRITELDEDDLFFDRLDFKLKKRAHNLQLRRWRKLKQQTI